tara:strand:+ start:135 stop:1157 length:1023 start_codon:yes stop_codon:yes gene_type:complete
MKKKIFIFSNEKISSQNNQFYCDNIDLKSTPEGLNKKFEVNLFGRKSSKKKTHSIKIKNIKVFNNIFSYISAAVNASKNKESKFLVISITPYTFMICLFLRLFGVKPTVFLRSDGYGEYRAILGRFGPLIYHLMFYIASLVSNFISARKYILRGKKGKIIYPSQLDTSWLRKPKILEMQSFKLLYVGRIRVEKGIYSLANLIKNRRNISLTIVGAEKQTSYKISQSNIKILPNESNKLKLIKYYDDHNIFVLPSYTEGHPMVLLEALARRRPVIIFEDIKHVVGDKKGVFIAKRNFLNFFGILNQIKKNYKKTYKEMMRNKLPTNKEFIEQFIKAIDDFK